MFSLIYTAAFVSFQVIVILSDALTTDDPLYFKAAILAAIMYIPIIYFVVQSLLEVF